MDLLDRMCCGDGRDDDTRTNRWSVAQDVPLTAEHRDDNSCDHDDPMIVVRDALNVDHHLRCVLAEGWVQKKRSENEREKETLWKYRWARLVLARTPASPLQVPLLLIYRYPHSDAGSPSTVCHLDSTVIFPVDLERNENSADETGLLADACGFEIQPAGSAPPEASAHAGLVLAAFSASARNAWIYAISAALLAYEKEKAYRRRVSPKTLPRSPSSKSRRGDVARPRTGFVWSEPSDPVRSSDDQHPQQKITGWWCGYPSAPSGTFGASWCFINAHEPTITERNYVIG
jgi:hypothetical protein